MTTKESGFTLIEIMVSIAILGLAMAAVAMALRSASHWTERSEERVALYRTVLSLKDTVGLENLFAERSGAGAWPGGRFRWQAELVESGTDRQRTEFDDVWSEGHFEIGLFAITLELTRGRGVYTYAWREVEYRPR